MTSPSDPAQRRLEGHGLAVALPSLWEGRIYQRPTATDPVGVPRPQARSAAPPSAAPSAAAGALGYAGETQAPVLHLGNFALPGGRGDFGTGAVELLGPSQAFVALLEFGPEEVGSALFAEQDLPLPTPEDFDPNALQKRLAGQAGYQRFFTLNGRALCLYVVVGSRDRVWTTCAEVNRTLATIEVAPR